MVAAAGMSHLTSNHDKCIHLCKIGQFGDVDFTHSKSVGLLPGSFDYRFQSAKQDQTRQYLLAKTVSYLLIKATCPDMLNVPTTIPKT
jgi:hypothetical protein